MLKQSYAVFQQFQSQISSVKNFQDLRNLSNSLEISVSVQISSSTIWIACWNITQGKIHGTVEIGIQPKLSIKSDTFVLKPSRTLRIEQPRPIDFIVLEYRILNLIKQSIMNFPKIIPDV